MSTGTVIFAIFAAAVYCNRLSPLNFEILGPEIHSGLQALSIKDYACSLSLIFAVFYCAVCITLSGILATIVAGFNPIPGRIVSTTVLMIQHRDIVFSRHKILDSSISPPLGLCICW